MRQFQLKTLLSKYTGVTVIDRKIELPALGLDSAFIIILLLNCCSEDRRDLPWPVQTCIHAPYFRQCSDIDPVLAAQVRFENAKTRHFVAAVSFIAQQRPLLRIGVTLIRMRCAGCGVEAKMASKPPAAHPPVGLSNSYPYYRLGFLLLVTV